MGYFQVRYKSRVINYDCRVFIRLASGVNAHQHSGNGITFQKAVSNSFRSDLVPRWYEARLEGDVRYLPRVLEGKNKLLLVITEQAHVQCDHIGRFFALWATIQSQWQQLFYPNRPHCWAIFVKVSKSFISLVKSFLGNFYKHLAIFIWSHCPCYTALTVLLVRRSRY